MLRFQNRPDKGFTWVLTSALEEAIGYLKEDIDERFINFTQLYFDRKILKSFGGGIGGIKIIRNELEKLLKAHQSKDVYMPTDRHFQLLDRILSHFCGCYGDTVDGILNEPDPKTRKEYSSLVLKHKRKPVLALDFDTIFEQFFWDNDYDLPPELAQALNQGSGKLVQQVADISGVALGASLGTAVDTSDLQLEKYEPDPEWLTKEDDDWWLHSDAADD